MKKHLPSGAALVLPLLSFAILFMWVAPDCRAWQEHLEIPDASTGDMIFYVDVVTFYLGEGENVEEIYLMVSNDQIEFPETDGALRGKLRFEINVLDENLDVVANSDKTITVEASSAESAADRNVVQVLQSRVSVPPGNYSAKIVLEDLNARKKEIVSYIMGKYKRGETEVEFRSREFGPDGIALSDIEFARSLRRASEGAFIKSGFEVVPNAHRRYGLLLSELPIYFEVYDFRDAAASDTMLVRYRILNSNGNKMFEAENPIDVGEPKLGSTTLFDIASLPTGNYLLLLELLDGAGEVLAATERQFDVLWSVYSWGRYEMEALGDLTYVFTETEMERFKSLSPAEKEGFLKEFWADIDPTPGTGMNEALMEHFRRVKYADQHFGGASARGALTDRGRLYIKYGPPDDIQSHYSDYEFVQGTRYMEGSSEPVPTDPFSRVGIKSGTSDGSGWDQTGSETEALSDQRGGSTVHGKAYEIWSYDGAGEPVRRVSDRVPRSARLRFVLVDEKGYGDYRLVYSTEKEEY